MRAATGIEVSKTSEGKSRGGGKVSRDPDGPWRTKPRRQNALRRAREGEVMVFRSSNDFGGAGFGLSRVVAGGSRTDLGQYTVHRDVENGAAPRENAAIRGQP